MNQEAQIIEAIAEHLGLAPDDLDRHTSLKDDLALGPLELNDLLSDLSQKFSVIFNPEEIEHLKKVEDLVMLVEDNLLE